MSLEKQGYTKAIYQKSMYRVYSEINYNDYTIKLIDDNGFVFEVLVCDIKLIKQEE